MFRKILIANRGEIAVRIIRACREMGIKTAAVYSEADKDALHTLLADEAICIGPGKAADSYLNMERILSATALLKADAIHPGFGFLSENSRFAQMCNKCNITFIGPDAKTISRMGDKSEARNAMMAAGVPVVPGTKKPVPDETAGMEEAAAIGYPVMIKAALGGGGKGMRIARNPADFEYNFLTARQEAIKAFNDDKMYIEKYIEQPRHVEVQILADRFGNVVHLGERDCSIQKNHQKLIEESPCQGLSEELRKRIGGVAVRAAKAVGYVNAGTIEFLLDKNDDFYFMEMNTRIQVEHPVTEMVTDIDLIKAQIRIAAGEPLSFKQEDVRIQGHAIECRINAVRTGEIETIHFPGGKGIRIDSAIYNGYKIPPEYDSMLIKLIVHDKNRKLAVEKLKSALGELIIEGIDTNLDSQYEIVCHKEFAAGKITTSFIADNFS